MNVNGRPARRSLVALLLFVTGCTDDASDRIDSAITIYPAAAVITADPVAPRAEAVAVAGSRVLAVGPPRELMAHHPGAKLDETFTDKVVVAGFIDQHVHPFLAALTLTSEIVSIEDWVLPGRTFPAARDREDYRARLREAHESLADPDTPLISWGFHHYFHGDLSRADLDTISSARPIYVWHRSAHEFILNTPALASLGVTKDAIGAMEEAIRAQIDLDAGHFWERGAFEFLLPRIMPVLAAPERFRAGLELMEAYLHASGVTLAAEPGGSTDMYDTYNSVLGDAATPIRFYFMPGLRTGAAAIPGEGMVRRTEAHLAPVTAGTAPLEKHIKLFTDGAMFSQLMQMQDGYTDGHHGEWLMEPGVFAEAFRAFWDAGYQIHVHNNGDAGLEVVLDTLEENLKRRPRDDHRTTVVHFGFAKAEQVDRIARLGAIVSANPYYTVALADRYSEIGIGPERADEMVRLGDVSRVGVSFSLHSDMPMAPSQPLFLMWSAINRTTPSGRVAGPQQRVSVQQALQAVTIDAAYSLGLEGEVGSITPGKRANFTILESDPFAVEPMAIKDIEVWGTMIEGRIQPVAKARRPHLH